jgi:hypothetical protein
MHELKVWFDENSSIKKVTWIIMVVCMYTEIKFFLGTILIISENFNKFVAAELIFLTTSSRLAIEILLRRL